jgi:hypothetical protein
VQQHPIYAIASCTIQELAHRKQGHVLPTLVLHIFPDSAGDRSRKRRSSRPTPFTSNRDTLPTTLWFRSADDRHNIYDWARYIQPLIQPYLNEQSPSAPTTPSSPLFTNPNPFANGREPSNYFQSGPLSSNPHGTLQHKASGQTHSSRERDKYRGYSHTPSLKSRRSDLSQMSSLNPGPAGHPGISSKRPAELPSPASTVDEYHGEFIEGWTSAQGRSSTLSSPSIPRESFSSQQERASQKPSVNAGSPPGPRQTILDRAFQLGFIPGSEQDLPGAGKISSVAKFEAIAREKDVNRKRTPPDSAPLEGLRSVWDPDDSDAEDEPEEPSQQQNNRATISRIDQDHEDEEDEEAEDEDEEDENPFGRPSKDDTYIQEQDLSGRAVIPPSARRALDFITGRRPSQVSVAERTPVPTSRDTRQSARSTVVYDRDSVATLHSGSSRLRPQTGYTGSKTPFAQRTYSQPHLAALDGQSHTSDRTPEEGMIARRSSARIAREQRSSGQSTKRLSFTDFTKRLSSTSSLLLVQTNTSIGGSSRGSSEVDPHQVPKGNLQPRSGGTQQPATDRDADKRCGWRGSVGVFGAEGGFI